MIRTCEHRSSTDIKGSNRTANHIDNKRMPHIKQMITKLRHQQETQIDLDMNLKNTTRQQIVLIINGALSETNDQKIKIAKRNSKKRLNGSINTWI